MNGRKMRRPASHHDKAPIQTAEGCARKDAPWLTKPRCPPVFGTAFVGSGSVGAEAIWLAGGAAISRSGR